MAKKTKTDACAFNKIRFNKINFKDEAQKAREEVEKMHAEIISSLKASLKASKSSKTSKTKKFQDEKIRFSNAPEFLKARLENGTL